MKEGMGIWFFSHGMEGRDRVYVKFPLMNKISNINEHNFTQQIKVTTLPGEEMQIRDQTGIQIGMFQGKDTILDILIIVHNLFC